MARWSWMSGLLGRGPRATEFAFYPPLQRIAPVENQYYGHGGFMGCAPALLADDRWRSILSVLMPDVYEEVAAAVLSGAGSAGLVPMFENNPVSSAFGVVSGVARRRERGATPGPHDLEAVEWDAFVASPLVEAWERAKDETVRAGVLTRMVDTMLVAHATTSDTVQEAFGLCQYEDVRRTAKTKLGGVEAPAWMDLFARALALAADPTGGAAMAGEARVVSEDACRRYTFAKPWSFAEAIARYHRATGRELAVFLELKSRRATPALLRAITGELNTRGVRVAGVASFVRAHIAGVGTMQQVIDGATRDGPREVLLLHYAGDLQAACDAGVVPHGQSVLFNGGSLLEAEVDRDRARYRVRDDVVDGVAAYRARYGLEIGLYVQEADCGAAAADLLSRLVADRAEVFGLGFAWGGLHDQAVAMRDGDRRGLGDQRLLERVGRAKPWRLPAVVARDR